MNRFYQADPQFLATIHSGMLRSTRSAKGPKNPSLELPASDSLQEEPATLSDQFNLRRRKAQS